MTTVRVKIKKKHPDVPTPTYETVGSAGCDVTAAEAVEIEPGGRTIVKTGLFLELPQGYECQVRARSGLAIKHGVTVLNSPGTIDSDYRGEVGVILINTGQNSFRVEKGDRIAQLVFAPVTFAYFAVVEELDDTQRGSGGYGSTGVR